ncbi:unnamed protein product, partial [Brenthis ino]
MRESLRRLASDDGMVSRLSTGRVRVELLTGEHITLDVERKSTGADLLDSVCDALDILEKDYFGLLHTQRDSRQWVDLKRRLTKSFRNEPWDVRFAVKFYPPEPSELHDEVTRYQVGLAIRRDLIEGRLKCSTITYALLASYVLQAELGDREGKVPTTILSTHNAVPLQVITPDFEDKVDELYRKHKGQTPAEAELNYLENAKKLALYGAELHSVRDSDDAEIILAVCSGGIAILRDGIIMSRFPWAMVSKLSYRARAYWVRLRPTESLASEQGEARVGFRLGTASDAKRLWRCSVEFHMFYRREAPVKVERITGFPRFGSRRVSCRSTLRQLRAI